jgi:hypothetical protein
MVHKGSHLKRNRINISPKIYVKHCLSGLIFCIVIFASGCVSPFEPVYHPTDEYMVVDASIIKGQATQVVEISKSSPITQHEYKPVGNCQVKIIDDSGNEFLFHEESAGRYVADIDDALIKQGGQYKLEFSTPEGENYESEYQRVLPTEPVESIYGIKEYHYSPQLNNESLYGMQFYGDLDLPDDASKFYKWQLEETYEIQSGEGIWGVYDGQDIKVFKNQDSLRHCWKTCPVSGLYSASTVGLSSNKIKKIPLSFISGTSTKLMIKYCLTVKQYALNEDAYNYWNQRKIELYESGEIYTRQPGQPISNIHNTGKPEELVLGFFWASSCRIKRLFVKNPFSKEPEYGYYCQNFAVFVNTEDVNELKNLFLDQIKSYGVDLPKPPIYISQTPVAFYLVATPICVDCRKTDNSDTQKPDFWQ